MFLGWVTSENAEADWPTHSPDLSLGDYSLWGYLLHKVYDNRPHNINRLQFQWACRRQTKNPPRRRAEDCSQEDGAHMTNIVLRK
jgi:hypothetical protein